MFDGLNCIENITIRIRDENSSINNSETKLLNHDLKSDEVESIDVQSMAKGERSTNTFIKIYLTEKINIIFKNPIDVIVLMIPSMEKMVSEFSSIDNNELDISIKLENLISVPKKL